MQSTARDSRATFTVDRMFRRLHESYAARRCRNHPAHCLSIWKKERILALTILRDGVPQNPQMD